jgi:hypothetical protein
MPPSVAAPTEQLCAVTLLAYGIVTSGVGLWRFFSLLSKSLTLDAFAPLSASIRYSARPRHQHKYMLAEEFEHYHGEAVNPKHLSLFERCGGSAAAANHYQDKEPGGRQPRGSYAVSGGLPILHKGWCTHAPSFPLPEPCHVAA